MWVSPVGPFNEHLVRDFGEFNLALGVFTVCAAVSLGRCDRRGARVARVAVPHLVYHRSTCTTRHPGSGRHHRGPGRCPVLAVVLLVASRSLRRRREPARAARSALRQRPAFGFLPWFALLRRALSLRFLVFLDTGDLLGGVGPRRLGGCADSLTWPCGDGRCGRVGCCWARRRWPSPPASRWRVRLPDVASCEAPPDQDRVRCGRVLRGRRRRAGTRSRRGGALRGRDASERTPTWHRSRRRKATWSRSSPTTRSRARRSTTPA